MSVYWSGCFKWNYSLLSAFCVLPLNCQHIMDNSINGLQEDVVAFRVQLLLSSSKQRSLDKATSAVSVPYLKARIT